MSKTRRSNIKTKHHIVPKSRSWTNKENNIIHISDHVHAAFHRVFANKMPHEQFAQLLSINWTALRDEFVQQINEILDYSEREYFYKNGVMRHR